MLDLAEQQDGFLGVESAREDVGITVSYWRDLASIKSWKENTDHSIAREKGRKEWYKSFKTRIAKVERDYELEETILRILKRLQYIGAQFYQTYVGKNSILLRKS